MSRVCTNNSKRKREIPICVGGESPLRSSLLIMSAVHSTPDSGSKSAAEFGRGDQGRHLRCTGQPENCPVHCPLSPLFFVRLPSKPVARAPTAMRQHYSGGFTSFYIRYSYDNKLSCFPLAFPFAFSLSLSLSLDIASVFSCAFSCSFSFISLSRTLLLFFFLSFLLSSSLSVYFSFLLALLSFLLVYLSLYLF